uniref:hypothetical protein n=1 Tax=Eisenbergiella tayi TaxID=1432052 RepID=UPI003FEDF202
MDGCNETSIINHDILDTNDIILLLGAYAKLRFLLHMENLDFDKGITVLLDNSNNADQFIKAVLNETEAVFIKDIHKKYFAVQNNQLGLHIYHKYDSANNIIQFLSAEDFLPVLVITGIISDFIRENTYILRLDTPSLKWPVQGTIKHELDGLVEFVKQNTTVVQFALAEINISERSESAGLYSLLWAGLISACWIFMLYFKNGHSKEEKSETDKRLVTKINIWAQQADELKEKYEMTDAIRNTIRDYFTNHADIMIGEINNVEGDIIQGIKKGMAILFDRQYYFIPEKLLKSACSPFLSTVSFIDIKQQLHTGGIIECYGTTNQNYTVKKVFVTVYGEICRERFIKMKRYFLTTQEGLALEDMKGVNICTLEKSETNQS